MKVNLAKDQHFRSKYRKLHKNILEWEIKKLVKEAYANSLAKVKDKKQILNGQTIVKSISERSEKTRGEKLS